MEGETNGVEYLQQKDVRKVKHIPLSHYQYVIVYPKSLIAFESWEDEHLEIGDKVAFQLRFSLDRINGTIKAIGKANGFPSSVVELV